MNRKLVLVLIAAACTSVLGADDSRDAAKKDLETLQGEWKLVSATQDRKTMPADDVKVMKCTIKGDKFTITRDGKVVDEGKYKMCYSPPGKDRPKDFEAQEGTGRTLSVWEREKK